MNNTSHVHLDSATDSNGNHQLHIFLAAIDWISTYYTMFLIVVGCVCNPLSVIVLSRKIFRDSTMSLYLRFLSLMDLGAILTGLTRLFQKTALKFDVRHQVLSCQFNFWMVDIFLYTSCWTLVAVTTERVISIIWPHQVKIVCSPVMAKVMIAVITALVGAVCSPVFALFGNLYLENNESNTTTVRYCVVLGANRVLATKMYWSADGILFTFIPCSFLLIFNIIIIYGVVKSRERVQRVRNGPTINERSTIVTETEKNRMTDSSNSSASNCSKKSTENSDRISTSSHYCASEGNLKNSNRSQKRTLKQLVPKKTRSNHGRQQSQVLKSKKETSLTLTVLAINITFIVCNFPVDLWALGPHYELKQGLGEYGDGIASLLLILMYSNNALNFFLYCITGSKFRSEVKATVRELFNVRSWFKCR